MATSARLIPTRIEATGSPRQPPALNDELLEEIFLRIASPADLARASTACVSFRRLIADPAFLRRYRSLHPPPLLGFLSSSNSFRFKPVEAPCPNAPAARALDRAADFSFDYVPLARGLRWYIGDVRSGRVLLVSLTAFGSPLPACCRPHLAVCDPLSRGYLLLPPVPGDLLASVQMQQVHLSYLEAFLAPCGEEEDDTSFRVICWVECWVPCSISVVFVFSSASGLWSVGASTSWDALSLNVPGAGWPSLSRARSADGWLYWKVLSRNKLLKLDINRMEFSTIDLPPGHENRDVVIVEAGEGRTVMVSHISSETFMCYAIRQNEGQNANEWKMENKILLPIYLKCRLMGAAGGYIFLLDRYRDDGVHVSLHVKTLNIETSCWKGFYLCLSYPYFGFAPSMSPRRI
ncbi:hypothetical protein ACP70R_005650 [Stipagrostis hirtigluma subsp. patula]